MSDGPDESGAKSGNAEPGALVPQPHGGAILRGSKPGHPATGAPPSELRRRMRGALAERIEIATSIADSDDTRDADRIRALDFLARYGIGPGKHEGYDADLIRILAESVQRHVPDPAALAAIESEWKAALRARLVT